VAEIPNIVSVVDRLKTIWANDDDALAACLRIIEFLKAGGTEAHFITLQDLAGREAKGFNADALLKATTCLSSGEIPLLSMKFQLIDEDDDEETLDRTVYSPTEYRQFEQRGKLVNPQTGEEDPDLYDKLFVFFEPTSFAKDVFAKRP